MISGNFSDDEMLPPSEISLQRKSIKSSIQQTSNEILKAYQVTSFKYIDSKYENRGKTGLALLGSKSNNNFSLLLYGKGNVAVTQAYINKDFDVSSARDLYVSFYDIKSENWSLLFESMENYIDFFNRVSILKLISSKQDIIYVDIKSGDGNFIRDSDLCEAEIVIYGIKNCEIISTLYNSEIQEVSKLVRFKLGTNKLMPAIDKGVMGMMKGGHRIICVSSNSSLIKGGSIKVGSDILVTAHVKIVRIKTKTEKPIVNNEYGDAEISLPNINFIEKNIETDTQQSKKAELMNLMIKIGKPILQLQSNDELTKNPEVTSTNYNYSTPAYDHSAEYNSRSLASAVNISSYNSQLLPVHASNPMMSTVHQFYPSLGALPQPSDNTLVFTEMRQHNTEMRLVISKLQDKIDRISDKIDNNNSVKNTSVVRHMDAENVFENIKRIIDENEILKRECSQKSDTIDSQNKRINELLNKNQRYLEDSRNVLDRNSITFNNTDSENQSKILKLEEEKLDLIRSLSKKTSDLSKLELKMESIYMESQGYRNKSLEFNDQLNKLTTELDDFKIKNRTLLTELEKLKEDYKSSVSVKEELEKNKRQSEDNERKLQQVIETLKYNLKEASNNLEQVRSECDSEIMDIRQHCNKEIEDLRNKLKQERRIKSSKSSDLENEIENINKEWEARLEELKKSENLKLSKIKERNSQLVMDNSLLSQDILDLKDQLTLSNNNKSVKFEELSNNNRQLHRQLDNLRDKADEVEKLRSENCSFEKEIIRLSNDLKEIDDLKRDLEASIQRKRELESMVIALTEELNLKPIESTSDMSNHENVEARIKEIMNDIFKKIKVEFELEKSYTGKDVIGRCMIVIRNSTIDLMKSDNAEDDSDNDDKGSSQSEDSDSESNVTENTVEETKSTLDSLQPCFIKDPFNNTDEEVLINATESLVNSSVDVEESDETTKIVDTEEEVTVIEKNGGEDSISEEINCDTNIEAVVNESSDTLVSTNQVPLPMPTIESNQNMNISTDPPEIILSDHEIDEILPGKNDIDPEKLSNNPDIPVETVKHDTGIQNSETITPNEDKKDASKIVEKDAFFSSDDDDDVSGFFEKLNQKKKVKEVKLEDAKPMSKIDNDDDLSWLNS